ncbi:nitroreductase [Nicoletella semolina]|uniref:Putative NAD(P)H nitroreductase n=1 Tax=Nicoletella semolina TaxID=271160 RepID=A0A4R2NBX6_9PAST|nr:nitroreductase family protein [Nicoletella semolina]MDH2925040.1 nitroreductase [Nicoletella semolina]TCP18590.1 nitroreductase [Nicoletella semolina]
MDVLSLLPYRRSSKKFGEIAPNAEQLKIMFQSALRVPDHGRLKPYRFVVIEKQAMGSLEELLKASANEFEMGKEARQKAENLCQRSPMMIGVVAKIAENIPKVPAWEQMISAGCATYALQLAANAQGFETCWISNQWIKGSALRHAFQCEDDEQIIALLMIGSPCDSTQISLASQPEEIENFVYYLNGSQP